jgi:TBC1 domain family protein 5
MSPILGRCSMMYEIFLPKVDKELYKSLKYHNLEPHIFLLYKNYFLNFFFFYKRYDRRWIRCIFTREFHLSDAINVWDSLFYEYYLDSENNRFFLIDCMCLAMICYVRAERKIKNKVEICN